MQRVRNLWLARRGVSWWHARRHPDYELEESARSVVQFRMYFRKLHHALRMRRLTSTDRSALWLTFPPRYTNSFVWLYTWPAASTLNMAVDSDIPFARKCYEPLERSIGIMEPRQSNGGQQRHYPFRHPKWRYPYQKGLSMPRPTPYLMTSLTLFTTDPQPQQLS